MKKIQTKLLITLSIFFLHIDASDYANATFDNYVSGQGVNEVLAEAQSIICALSRMGTEDLAGDGSYKATIYINECEQAAVAATDNTEATSQPTSATTSSNTSASASAATTEAAPEIDTVFVNTGFTTASMQTTKGWIVNDKPWNEQTNREPKNILYLLNEQTAPVSDTNKFGDFTLRYQLATFGNTQEDLPEWYTCPDPSEEQYKWSWCADGADLGRGLLIAEGGSIKFKSDQVGSEQQNVVADYFDNGDIAGIYTRSRGFMDESLRDDSCDEIASNEDGSWDHDAWWACQPEEFKNSQVDILGIFAFGISSNAKTYCTKMSELYEVDWSVWDEETQQPKLAPYTLTEAAKSYLGDSASWDTEEKCFSIDKNDAIRNIWDYGVFNSDGSSLKNDNQSFPIRTTVAVDDVQKRVHGYASYWGVHVDHEYQDYITDSTEWFRDDWRNNSDSTDLEKYNLKVKSIEVDKREKSFSSLNSLDGANFRFWVNDSWWSDEFQKLGFPKVEPWEGKIQFKTSKATFTDYNNGNSSDPLTYSIYGKHNGSRYYVADLKGAKLDKDNIRKIIENDSSDPGKPMNLTMEFNEFPDEPYSLNDWERDVWVYLILCNKEMEVPTKRELNDWDYLGITSGMCIKVWGNTQLSADGTELILSSRNRDSGQGYYQAEAHDFDSGTTIYFNSDNWNNSGYEYDMKITLGGVERPAGLEVKLKSLLSRFGGLSQFDPNGGDYQRGLEAFLDSSDTFTYIVNQAWLNLYDHEGNRFNSIMGSFNVSDTPPVTVFIDDAKVTEPDTGTLSTSYNVSLSSAQASSVTFDYKIAENSTASPDDYSLENGSVTIPAGQTSATIEVLINADDLAEGQTDEKLTIALSNPTNAVLGRDSADIFIYDPDTNRIVYDDYYGSFNAETSTFTISEGIKYNPRYERLDLPEPITFTTTDWLNNMFKIWNEGEEWEHIDKREISLYSDELQQDYNITHAAMLNPDSASKEAGISTTKWSRVSISELPESLNCIENCLLGAAIKNHYTNAKNQADPDGDNTYTGSISSASPSPMADVGPYIKKSQEVTVKYNEGTDDEWQELRSYTRGDWQDGIIASDVVTYTVENNSVVDANGDKLETGVEWGVSRPGEEIKGSYFVQAHGGWQQQTEWGVWGGTLVTSDDLQYLECDFTIDEEGVKTYNEVHPEYTTANKKVDETRYCQQKMWGNDDILVSYNINLRLEKQYDIYKAADSSKLELDPPKTLFFRAPNDKTKFGNDAGKKFRLDYHGDHLGGIPGDVVNIETGESLGEYVDEWKDEYRWVQRFVIPDGSVLEDTAGNEYLTKALRGEEWLGKKDSAIGSLSNLLSLKTKDDLLTNADVDWEISQRKEVYYDCNLVRIRTDTHTYIDGDGNEQTETHEWEETDWDACHALEYGSDEYNAAWSIRAEFDNCNERLQYDYDQKAQEIAERRANDESNGGEYNGPNSPYDDPGWMGVEYTNTYIDQNGNEVSEFNEATRWGHAAQMERCKAIGVIPTTLINSGNPSVVNGDTVYDPTPNN
jgi:hypothetical protein